MKKGSRELAEVKNDSVSVSAKEKVRHERPKEAPVYVTSTSLCPVYPGEDLNERNKGSLNDFRTTAAGGNLSCGSKNLIISCEGDSLTLVVDLEASTFACLRAVCLSLFYVCTTTRFLQPSECRVPTRKGTREIVGHMNG